MAKRLIINCQTKEVIEEEFEFVPHMPTSEEIQKQLTDAVQNHLDTKAKERGYDDIKSAVTYADEPVVPQFQQEGQAYRARRSLVWAHCYEQLDLIQRGIREDIPTTEELIAELPVLNLL
jgi:hypothetical protein